MVISRFEQPQKTRASRHFTDREEPMQTFIKVLTDSNTEVPYVVSFYGVGGVGKTRLCTEFKNKLDSLPDPAYESASIDFGIPSLRESVEALLFLRRQLSYDCVLFDFTMIRYWSLLGRPLSELNSKLDDAGGGLVKDVVDHGAKIGANLASLGSSIPSVDLLIRIVKSLKKKWKLSKKEFETFIAEIGDLEATELHERLPYYLGKDISRNTRDRPALMFIDTYEHLWLDSNSKLKPIDTYTDQWVRDLIASSPGLVAFIFSRRKLDWEEIAQEGWNDSIEEHLLGELSQEDSEKYLRSIPITDTSIIRHIVNISGGLPFVLDICVDIYLERQRRGVSTAPSEFGSTKKQVIEIALKHLSLAERETIRLLSVPRVVDRKLFTHLVKDFETGYPSTAFNQISQNVLFQETGSTGGMRLHDITRAHILDDMEPSLQHEIGESILTHFKTRFVASDDERVYIAGEALHVADPVKQSHLDTLFQVIRPLLDRGIWLPVKLDILEGDREQKFWKSYFISVIRAVIDRRIGDTNNAREIFDNLDWQDRDNELEGFALFEYGDTCRVTGRLDKAGSLYSKVANLRYASDQDKFRAVRQLADLLMLKGQFCEALEMLLDQERKDKEKLDKANTYRQIAHLYRFNLDFETAGEYYKRAYTIAVEIGDLALQGKLLTNTLENDVFGLYKAIDDDVDNVFSMHSDMGSKIELGKSQLAMGNKRIFMNDDLDRGFSELNSAYVNFTKAGYEAGIVDFCAYSALCALASRSIEAYTCFKNEFERQSVEKDCYRFLRWMVDIEHKEELDKLEKEYQWLDWSKTKTVICKIYESLQNAPKNKEAPGLALALSKQICTRMHSRNMR